MKTIRRTIKKEVKPEPEEIRLVSGGGSATRAKTFAKLEERVTSTVSKSQLETLYHVDGITFRDVNDYVDKAIGPGFYLEGKESLVKLSNLWLERVKAKRVMEDIVKDIFISGAGNAWIELGYNAKGNNIPKLFIINPKYMDYIRNDDKNKNVKIDPYGEAIGFVRSKGMYGDATQWTEKNITKGGKIAWTSKDEEDGRDRIAHFKLFSLGEAFLGQSPTETTYKAAIIRLNLEDNVGEAGYRSGGIIATIGRENQPTVRPAVVDQVVKDLQNVDIHSVFGFPLGVKIERFPTPELTDRADLLLYFAGVQAIGMGVPISRRLLPGTQGNAPKGGNEADIDYEQRIIALQDRLAEQVREKLLFRYLKAIGKVKDIIEVPKIIFRSISPHIVKDALKTLGTLGRRGLVRRDPLLEKYVRDQLGLPTKYLEREIKQWEEDKTKIPTESKSDNRNIETNPSNKPSFDPKDKEDIPPKDKGIKPPKEKQDTPK